MPDRILIALFPKLTLYEFRLENALFPEFLKILEKLPAPNSGRTCSRINAVRCADFGLLEAFSAIPERFGEQKRDGVGLMDKPVAVVEMGAARRMHVAAAGYLLSACWASCWLSQRLSSATAATKS